MFPRFGKAYGGTTNGGLDRKINFCENCFANVTI
jgi:hypothetical protein